MYSTMRRRLMASSSILAGALSLALAAGAQAQTQTTPSGQQDQTPPAATTPPPADQSVVVTGSRIRRTNFTSPEPIQVITSEESTLAGLADTTQILQQSSVAANSTQINNFFTGFLVNGGAGVNTLNLRGLGAARTLVLLNGRRLGPAGVGGTVGSVDLNTIPSSIIDHTEILTNGASSIYGSDAVAGVVNVITRKNLDGGDIHAFVNPGERPGGEVWEADAAWGKTFNRGFFSVSGQVYRQEALHTGQRSYLSCTQDLQFDPKTGARLDIIDPATGKPKCQNSAFLGEIVEDSFTGYSYVLDPTAREQRGGISGFGSANLNGLRSVGNVIHTDGSVDSPFGPLSGCGIPFDGNTAAGHCAPVDIAASRASLGQFGTDDPRLGRTTAFSPVRRYTAFATGGFDLDSHNQLYGELLLNRRVSTQDQMRQFFPTVNAFNAFNPFVGTGLEGGVALPISLRSLDGNQRVDYYRGLVGIRGDLPANPFLKNWTYDLVGQYSRSDGVYGQDFTYQDRVNATAGSSNAAGCDPNAISVTNSKSLAQVEGPNALCMPINYFTQAHLLGIWTPAEKAYLFGYETGETTYDHAYIEGNITGDLFTLPAGPVGTALGFHVRRESIDDVPGPNAQARNYWGFSTAGITKGSQSVAEAFGEMNIPVLKNVPLVENLTLNLSGRYSDYNLYGSSTTYKAGVNWIVNRWVSFRATQGTSFRAPTLYERFLNPTLGFSSQFGIDPCIAFGSSRQSQVVKTNCAAQGVPPNYTGAGASASVFGGGGATLQPETSTARTLGVVFTPKLFNLDFSLAVDYYSYDVQNQIERFGAANIILQCLSSSSFPKDPFCALFTRDPKTHNILTVNDDYVNVADQIEHGLDVTIRFTHSLPYDWRFRFNSDLNWTLGQRTRLVNGALDSSNTAHASVGTPAFNGNMVFRFDHGPWTVNWLTNMVGASSDLRFLGGNINPDYQGLGIATQGIYTSNFYAIHTLSVRRRIGDMTIEAGIKNLFDKRPPVYSTGGFDAVVGTTPISSQYDLVGRSFFLDIDHKF